MLLAVTLAEVCLWLLAGRYAEFLALLLDQMRQAHPDSLDTPRVASAEKALGGKAEFSRDRLPNRDKLVRYSRAFVVVLYLAAIVFELFSR